jgi:hypothetical protein
MIGMHWWLEDIKDNARDVGRWLGVIAMVIALIVVIHAVQLLIFGGLGLLLFGNW